MRKSILILSGIVIALIFIFIYVFSALIELDKFQYNVGNSSITAAETAIRKAAVQCYALEGSYPPDIDYLTKHYGLVLNNKKYFYYYDIIGSNILPAISVAKRWE